MKKRAGMFLLAAVACVAGLWSYADHTINAKEDKFDALLSIMDEISVGATRTAAAYGYEISRPDDLERLARSIGESLGTTFAPNEEGDGYRGDASATDVQARWIVQQLPNEAFAYVSLRLEADTASGLDELRRLKQRWTEALDLNPQLWRASVQASVPEDLAEDSFDTIRERLGAKSLNTYQDAGTTVLSLHANRLPAWPGADMNAQAALRRSTTDGSYTLTVGTPVIIMDML